MGKEQGNMKEMFRQAIIGGYRKKEVEEYIYFLINETENLKAENISAKKEQKKEIEEKEQELQEKIKELEEKNEIIEKIGQESGELEKQENIINSLEIHKEQLEEEKRTLQEKNQKLSEKNSALLFQIEEKDRRLDELSKKLNDELAHQKEYERKVRVFEEKIAEYERRSYIISDILTDARLQAAQITEKANQEAEETRERANREAEEAREKANKENEIRHKTADQTYNREMAQKLELLMKLKVKMNEYLEKLDEIQVGIEKIHGNMSRNAETIPTNIEDLKSLLEKKSVEVSEDN